MFKPFRSHSGLLGWVFGSALEDLHRFWRGFLQRDASLRALWSDWPNCSHSVSQKFKRIRRFSDLFPCLEWIWGVLCFLVLRPRRPATATGHEEKPINKNHIKEFGGRNALEASQGKFRGAGRWGQFMWKFQFKGQNDRRDIWRDRWDMSMGQTGHTPGGVPPKLFMFIGSFVTTATGFSLALRARNPGKTFGVPGAKGPRDPCSRRDPNPCSKVFFLFCFFFFFLPPTLLLISLSSLWAESVA